MLKAKLYILTNSIVLNNIIQYNNLKNINILKLISNRYGKVKKDFTIQGSIWLK